MSSDVNLRLVGSAASASLRKCQLPRGKQTAVTVSNQDTDGHVVADGVQLVRVKP